MQGRVHAGAQTRPTPSGGCASKFANLHGSAGRPITIQNAGGTVTITGTRFLAGGIAFLNSTYVHLTGTGVSRQCGATYAPAQQACGIEIAATLKGITIETSMGTPHDLELDHVYIHDTTTDPNISATGISIHPVQRQTISGFYVHHNYIVGTNNEGLYMGAEPYGEPFNVLGKMENVEVSYNLVERTGYDGIKVKVAIKNVKVHHNIVRHAALRRDLHHETGIQLTTSVGEVYNNLVATAIDGIVMGRALSNPGTRYFNNLVVGVETVGLKAPEEDALVYNNTVVKSGSVGISAPGAKAQVFDNIVVDTAGTPIQSQPANSFNNLTGSVAAAGFVNPTAGDYHLLATSPAVDAGRNTGTFPAWDYADTRRPQGAKTDLGAYEVIK